MALAYRALCAVGVGAFVDSWVFFRYTILALNGAGHSALALLASDISGNAFAGVACFAISFLNRFQISRLGNFSSSNLRELWGMPLLWMQTLCLWWLLQGGSGSRRLWAAFGALTFVFIVVWQFSPFLLLLQATALYFVYLVCGYRHLRPVVVRVVDVYLAAMALAVLVHFGSPYLMTSPFLFQLLALRVALTAFCWRAPPPADQGAARALTSWLMGRLLDVAEGLVAIAVFLAIRKAAEPFATADTHVYEILCTKVATFNDMLPTSVRLPEHRLPACAEPSFNARLYLIMGVFNIIERASLQIYYDSSAGPAALLACLLIVARCVAGSLTGAPLDAAPVAVAAVVADVAEPRATTAGAEAGGTAGLRRRKGAKPESDASEASPTRGPAAAGEACVVVTEAVAGPEGEDAALLFFVVQSVLFFMLGGIVNRLRVAFGPPMMVLAAACCGPRLFPLQRLLRLRHSRVPLALALAALHLAHLAWMARAAPCVSQSDGLCVHLSDKSSSDGDLADLCDWMNRALNSSAPVLSSMNLAGSLRLFTKVPTIVHPQFESENLRKRVQLGYELYHCGSEESFARTMQTLSAEVVVFEYFRCFFTPYILDDRRKNCMKGKHKPEDQLCLKLHANSRRFELLFVNGGYAVFRLRPKTAGPRDGELPSPENVGELLAQPETWRGYVAACAREQGADCGPRLMEAAATWQHSVKRPLVAQTLRKLAETHFRDDGYVHYYMGRHLDYDANQAERAGPHYRRAAELLPNNAVVLKEYVMYLDMAARDQKAIRQFLEDRRGRRGGKRGGPVPLLQLEGAGVGTLLCEARIRDRQKRRGGCPASLGLLRARRWPGVGVTAWTKVSPHICRKGSCHAMKPNRLREGGGGVPKPLEPGGSLREAVPGAEPLRRRAVDQGASARTAVGLREEQLAADLLGPSPPPCLRVAPLCEVPSVQHSNSGSHGEPDSA